MNQKVILEKIYLIRVKNEHIHIRKIRELLRNSEKIIFSGLNIVDEKSVFIINVSNYKKNNGGITDNKKEDIKCMVRPSGLEPPTPTMSRWCSNQLSYGRT